MSKPRQSEYGKGDYFRSNLTEYERGHDNIDWGHSQPYFKNGTDLEAGWYYKENGIEHGPFNTWMSCKKDIHKKIPNDFYDAMNEIEEMKF